MLAGRAMVITWCKAMAEALQDDDKERVMYLFNAALYVPIRMLFLPGPDECHLAGLSFSEYLFASAAASGADSFWKVAQKACRLSSLAPMLAKAMLQSLPPPRYYLSPPGPA